MSDRREGGVVVGKVRIRIKETKLVPASQLIPHPMNARTHPERQRAVLLAMLDEVGFAGAVLVRRTRGGKYQILDGHLRAEEMGAADVPVLVTDLSAAEARKLLLLHDRIGQEAEIDADLLQQLASEVQLDAAPLQDLAAMMVRDAAESARKPGLTDPDAVPPAPEAPVTKPGDLWVLGDHRLLCADATAAASYRRLFGREPAAVMCFTDPPWNVSIGQASKPAPSPAPDGPQERLAGPSGVCALPPALH